MRLGATIADFIGSSDPDIHVAECLKEGYRAAPCPDVTIDQPDKIRDIKRAFGDADIVIAEVPAWVNPLHPDTAKRRANLDVIVQTLALADELEAVCCPTVVGSYNDHDAWDSHVGHDPRNFSPEAFDDVVQWIRQVLSHVNPRRSKLTLEMCPWTLLDSPEIYLEIITAVDHPGLAVHVDPANLVNNPRTYYGNSEVTNRCFDLLGPRILSCHAKDVHYTLDARTVGIEEVTPGRGVLDYATFLNRIEQLSPETPLIIEHLATQENFAEASGFIRKVAGQIGITV